MKDLISKMKALFNGQWIGEGFAKFPTIDNTAYTEQLEFKPDEFKDTIFFQQKTWYKNDTLKNGQTVFWDTGFIILREDKIILNSVQVGGHIETYDLVQFTENVFTFNSSAILFDVKTIKSQRIFTLSTDSLHYELNIPALLRQVPKLPSDPYNYHDIHYTAQVSPIGLRFGEDVAGFLEFGFGYKGLISGGLSVRF